MWNFVNMRVLRGGYAYLYSGPMTEKGKTSRVDVCKPKGEKGVETTQSMTFPSIASAKAWRETLSVV